MHSVFLPIRCILVLELLLSATTVCAGENLVPDPSFEQPKPKDRWGLVFAKWGGWIYEGECEFRVSRIAHSGQYSLLMVAGDPYYALDCREDDYAWCNSSPEGDLIPSVHFEQLREGLEDYRRMLTLARLCQERSGTEPGRRGQQLLAERRTAVSPPKKAGRSSSGFIHRISTA